MSVASSCAIHDFPKPGSHIMQPWENSKRTRQNWISASGWCEAFRNRHLQYFLKAISKKEFGSGALRLWWEARSIPLRSQIRTFERMPSKGSISVGHGANFAGSQGRTDV